MALQQWALPRISRLMPLDEAELRQIITYSDSLSEKDAAINLQGLLGDSPEALEFISSFNAHRAGLKAGLSKQTSDEGLATTTNDQASSSGVPAQPILQMHSKQLSDVKNMKNGSHGNLTSANGDLDKNTPDNKQDRPPQYAPPSIPPPANGASRAAARGHTNVVIEAAKVRARDEQEMQNLLQSLQYEYGIYNSEIEPEHESEYTCYCPIHMYQRRKYDRYGVQDMWSKAVMYPGEKAYNDNRFSIGLFNGNPYSLRVVSPYGMWSVTGLPQPHPRYHAQSLHQTIEINNSLNIKAQAAIDAKEPSVNIWDDGALDAAMSQLNVAAANEKKQPVEKRPVEKDIATIEKDPTLTASASNSSKPVKQSKLSSFRKSLGIKSSEERQVAKVGKAVDKGRALRDSILAEEDGRWPDEQWRYIVAVYQDKVGMTSKIADLRTRQPIQYLHLLRAGYFEPIPVAWASQASNPLKFSIEAAAGWRGITPGWRGYEDTAEERLYWVLNHREGSVGTRMKPDFISAMNMARARMAMAVEPPPEYYSANDICHVQHTSAGYSKQVMPPPFQAFDRPEEPTDETSILLDVSGSMDFDPVRPVYDQYLIKGFTHSTQPKNKDVAKAIIRRFTDAMAQHDHQFRGYDLTTFSSQAAYIGTINHHNLDAMWRNVRLGGGTRVMTGWQKVKERHFQKHWESATHHPVYGWQAGPQTPMLRLLLLLDGEATDMDEFELDLLGLSWAHVTIFLIGVDGCPHHHRHANELQRISDVNHHVSFVDAQGNTPERFVTHELLKRHLGYDVSMQEFIAMEELPAYTE